MKPLSSRKKTAVIGAGLAGLSAAVTLSQHTAVTLFEAGRQAGGRARPLGTADSGGFQFLDNGQHILIGAYRATLALLRQTGVAAEDAFLRLPMQWHMEGNLRFQTASLPAPLHLLWGIAAAKGMSSAEKFRFLNDMSALRRWHASPLESDTTAGAWLRARGVSRKTVAGFWQPLVLGALNTPLETAGLKTLCHVLEDSVWRSRADSDYLLPKQDLGSIFARPALAFLGRHGAAVRTEQRIPRLETLPDGRVSVGGEAFDAAVIAVAPYHAAALMPSETPPYLTAALDKLAYHAITTVYLRYDTPPALPAPLTGLPEGTAQWLLDRRALGLADNTVAAVISASDTLGALKSEDWANRTAEDIRRICPAAGTPAAVRVITEKRATPAALPGRTPPDTAWLHNRRIYPAGDYLHPRYPATIEAAVQSGAAAAELCMADLHL